MFYSTVALMQRASSLPVKTFSIGFDEPGYNELGYARIAARHFGAEHHEYMVTPEDVLAALDAITDVYDEPFGNASAVLSLVLGRGGSTSRMTRKISNIPTFSSSFCLNGGLPVSSSSSHLIN